MKGCYVIGEPGVGKSTAMAALTAGVDVEWRAKPFGHAIYRAPDSRLLAAQLGAQHEEYPGTDRLSMSVQPLACDWLWGAPAPFVFGEGDRLASQGFFEVLEETCDEWSLVHLSAPPEVIEGRRAGRGSKQNEKWLQGRRTKVRNLVEEWQHRLVMVDAATPTDAVVEQIRRQVPGFQWTRL